MRYLILFKETTIQEDTYCVSVDADSEEEAFTKAFDGKYTNREILYNRVLDVLNKNVIDIQKRCLN